MDLSSRERNDNSKQSPNYSINTSHLDNIECPKCNTINGPMNIYCKSCKSLLPQNKETSSSKNKIEPKQVMSYNLNTSHLENIECSKCKTLNDPMNIYCKSCNTLLSNNKKCKRCGTDMDQQLSYCPQCGTDTLMETKEITITTLKYNKASYILGLVGSIIGAAVFMVALALTMKFIYNKDLSDPFRLLHMLLGGRYRFEIVKLFTEYKLYTTPVILCLASFLTGFTGSIRANQYDESSRKLFFISSALSVICIFFNIWYIPVSGLILLTASILSLFKTTETRTIRTRIDNY